MVRGFTLVEVIVALLLLEVGLLGVVGTLVLASRTLTRAELEERGAASAARVLDSLVASGVTAGEGRTPAPGGEVRWRVEGGVAHLVFRTGVDSALVQVDGSVPPGGRP